MALTMFVIASIVGACQTTNSCDGFEPIRLKAGTADYIAHKDLVAATGILSHNEFGEKMCGWKAER